MRIECVQNVYNVYSSLKSGVKNAIQTYGKYQCVGSATE